MSDARGDRKLNLFDATLLVMGGILGVGIFFTPGAVAARVPELGPFLAMWVLGGVVALCGALTFAHLGARRPREGGWFVYLHEAWGRFPAFLFAWIVLLVVSTGALAVMASFCSSTLFAAFGADPDAAGSQTARTALELALLGGLTALACSGVKTASWVQSAFMFVKLGAVVAFVLAGLVFLGEPGPAPSPGPSLGGAELASAMLSAALPVLFAYGGWQMLGYTASEVRDPERTLPRAIVLGVSGVVLVYLAVNLAYVRTLGIEEFARLEKGFAPAAARAAFGDGVGGLLSAAMAVSGLGVLIVTVVATPWIYVAMAREGLFFEAFGRLHPRTNAPILGLLCQLAVAGTYLLALRQDTIDVLMDSVVFAEWFFHALVAAAVFRLGGVRGPLTRVAAGLYLAFGVVVVAGTLWQAQPERFRLGLVVLAAGALTYVPWTRWMARRLRTR